MQAWLLTTSSPDLQLCKPATWAETQILAPFFAKMYKLKNFFCLNQRSWIMGAKAIYKRRNKKSAWYKKCIISVYTVCMLHWQIGRALVDFAIWWAHKPAVTTIGCRVSNQTLTYVFSRKTKWALIQPLDSTDPLLCCYRTKSCSLVPRLEHTHTHTHMAVVGWCLNKSLSFHPAVPVAGTCCHVRQDVVNTFQGHACRKKNLWCRRESKKSLAGMALRGEAVDVTALLHVPLQTGRVEGLRSRVCFCSGCWHRLVENRWGNGENKRRHTSSG